jgi:diphosphate-dependent phosphofructokinase
MIISPLQQERAKYQPKLPKSLQGAVKVVLGEATQSIADQQDIAKLFPNTYGMPLITFEEGAETEFTQPVNVGVILSGGQAPGGHNVIAGIFDGVKRLNPEGKLYGFLGRPRRAGRPQIHGDNCRIS